MSRHFIFKIIFLMTRWMIRLAVVAGILLFIATLFMAGIGGNGDISKKSLEQVIGGMTGVQATVHDLKSYRVFPELKMDFKNMTGVLNLEKTSEQVFVRDTTFPDVILEQALFIQDLFQNLWGGPSIVTASFQNLILRPGILGPYALHLRTGNIEGPVDVTTQRPVAAFVMMGDYGDEPVIIRIPLLAHAVGKKWYYQIDGTSVVSIKWGGFLATGKLNVQKKAIIFDSLDIKISGHVFSGSVIIPRGKIDKNSGIAVFKLKTSTSDIPHIIQIDQFSDIVKAHIVDKNPSLLQKDSWRIMVRELDRLLKKKRAGGASF